MNKRFILLGIFALAALHTSAQSLQQTVEEKLQHPFLKHALWGGTALYSDGTQPPFFTINDELRLTPASTLKLLTTAAALELFGPHHRFETHLYAQGTTNEKGTLNGSLYLQGGGDMTLGSTRVTGAETWQAVAQKWAQAVKEAGIRQINGNLYADVSLFEGPSVAPKVNWENMGNYFAAPASPLCFNDNLFEIHFSPQLRGNQPVQVDHTDPQLPGLTLQSFVTTDAKSNKDNAYVYGAPEQYNLKIFGTIPTSLRGFTIKGALPQPPLLALQALQEALQKQDILVTGTLQLLTQAPDYTAMKKLHTYQSPELKDIIVIVNKRSFNLYADMLLRHLALYAGQAGSIENGVNQLKKFLTEHKMAKPDELVLYDGSGLSRDNLITPRVLVRTLNYMVQSPHFEYYYNSLATPDDRGDLLLLRRFLKPLKKIEEVRVKGGTIDSVKAAAGYVRNEQGKLISFVFMANNLAGKDEALYRIHEDIIKELLKQK
ncbi:MAG: D-alanyl-D-alanine carboxypeptidase/D-alanyl-D-alanine-endopeptidase [Elusimicrobiaceae bacterium]|nr:D-alanyl-D-alanine carboxypeptidase/D-alanyl-D-alanine-endopeptidase [Elusimicrobiaceae bacterium]